MKKDPKLKEVKTPSPNLKTGEVGLMISVKEKGKTIKHYTSKGKIKHIEYFMASMVKSMCKMFDLSENIDLIQWEDVNPVSIKDKSDKNKSDDEKKRETMKAIQEVINEKASEDKTIKKLENEKTT